MCTCPPLPLSVRPADDRNQNCRSWEGVDRPDKVKCLGIDSLQGRILVARRTSRAPLFLRRTGLAGTRQTRLPAWMRLVVSRRFVHLGAISSRSMKLPVMPPGSLISSGGAKGQYSEVVCGAWERMSPCHEPVASPRITAHRGVFVSLRECLNLNVGPAVQRHE